MMTTANARDERRGTSRTPAVMAVALGSDAKPGRHGVTRDLSPKGLLIVTPSRFMKGDHVKVTVHSTDGAVDVVGRVARVDENPISSPELWRYRLGIELDTPLPSGMVEIAAKA